MVWRAPTVTEELLREIADEIVQAVDPVQVILFGSRARGTAGPDSDLDLLIVEDRPFGPGHRRGDDLARLWERLGHHTIPIDLVLLSRDEVERWRRSPTHVIGEALREGRVLHERS